MAESKSSAVKILGEDAVCDLVSVTADNEGGFVVGANTWVKGHKDYWVLKYDADFHLLWERKIGSLSNETLQYVYVDESNNIFLGGIRTDFGLDTFQVKEFSYELPYYVYLDARGNLNWDLCLELPVGYGIGGYGHKCTNAELSADGNILVAGCIQAPYEQKGGAYLVQYGHLLELDKNDGQIVNLYASPADLYDALFELPDVYGVFYSNRDEINGGVALFDRSIKSGYVEFAKEVESEADFGRKWNAAARFKLSVDDNILMYYVYSDAIIRTEFNITNRSSASDREFNIFDNLSASNRTFDENIVFATTKGDVYETDMDLNILNTFRTNWKAQAIAKLKSGDFVIGYEVRDVIYLAHTNKHGEMRQYD